MKERFFRFLSRLVARYVLKKPDLADLIYSKYHTFKSYWEMVLNYCAWRLGMKKSFHIVSIVLEPTNHCTLRCALCPTSDDMNRERGYMDYDLFTRIIDENSNIQFVNLFLWGEPLLHPRIFEMIAYAKNKGIEASMYSNATLLDQKKSRMLLESGLDRIVISLDGVDSTYESIRNYPYEKVEQNVLELLAIRKEMNARTAIDVSMVVGKDTEDGVKEYKKRWGSVVDTLWLQRQNTYEKKQRTKSCFELWRGNVVVHWNGTVVPCFIDYDATVKLGDANTHSIKAIYNGEKFQQIRTMHTKGKFPMICNFCSEYDSKEVSSRVV